MPKNIEIDRKHFWDVIGGNLRKALKKFFDTGRFTAKKGKNGHMSIALPRINTPHIIYGDPTTGIGRGPGKKGDVIDSDKEGEKGNGAGQEEGEGVEVSVPMEYILQFMKDQLCLPDLRPKENDTVDEFDIKYNNISLNGPDSLRHLRRTMLEALRRLCATGEINNLHQLPGLNQPIQLITPIDRDFRFRQWKEIKKPSSNAVIMFGRDGSGSMDDWKCNVVSDMCWWIDVWIRHFYERVERCYFWHDTVAQELDEKKFYSYRYGGGTTCSSCLKLMANQFIDRFPPEKWNIYVFYFTDGDNYDEDNDVFLNTLKEKFPPNVCNLFGITQIMAYDYKRSLKKFVDDNLENKANYRSVSIGKEKSIDYSSGSWEPDELSDDERNLAIKKAIIELLGKKEAVLFDMSL